MLDSREVSVLLRRARQCSPEATNELLGGCRRQLLAFIRTRLGPDLRRHLEPEDVLQITLMRAFQRLHQFRGESREGLLSWLARIAQNVIRDRADYLHSRCRDADRTVPLGEALVSMTAEVRSELSRLILSEEVGRVRKALESLDPRQQGVILLRTRDELSFQDIARRLGRSPDACRMLLARAMARLSERVRADV